MSQNFIKTKDIDTAEMLRKLNFKEIPTSEPNTFVFLNCNQIVFSSDIDKKKLTYSNLLCM